ncbi:MAG: SRPBCC domain-containing protein [bacterium]|nr:SRPBCC domain-containing protein [bacterium]
MPQMQTVRAEIEIDAPPEVVFDILTDLERYPEWNPFTPRIDSSLEIGAAVRMRVRLREGRGLRRQVETVTANERPHKLCWGANIPVRFLIRADRCQRLESLEGGRTKYVCTDDISGWLTPIVIRYFGKAMRRGFEDCAIALKKRAESGARPSQNAHGELHDRC